ncbi:MAG TPA: hypothetical protein VGL94_12265 [Ktedonobacteraceae bacterium]|jgi:hypothetical protein
MINANSEKEQAMMSATLTTTTELTDEELKGMYGGWDDERRNDDNHRDNDNRHRDNNDSRRFDFNDEFSFHFSRCR